jgi:hypothetical protein
VFDNRVVGENMDLTGRKRRKDGEECTTGSCIICELTLHHTPHTHKLMQAAMGTESRMHGGNKKELLERSFWRQL